MPRGVLHQWTGEQDARLRAMWGEGCHVLEIALVVGPSPRSVYRRAAELNLPPRPTGARPVHPIEARVHAAAVAASGATVSQVAIAVGVARTTAWRWMMAARWGDAA